MTKNELPLWKEQLSAYLDNELSPADRRAFEEAMHRRPEIQREHDTLLALRSALKGLPATAPSADFFARAQKSGRATSRPWPLLFPSLIGAAAAALVMIVVSQDTRHRTDAPSFSPSPPQQIMAVPPPPGEERSLPAKAEQSFLSAKKMDSEPEERLLDSSWKERKSQDALSGQDSSSAPSSPPSAQEVSPAFRGRGTAQALSALEKTDKRKEPLPSAVKAARDGREEGPFAPGFEQKNAPLALGQFGENSGVTEFRTIVIRTEAMWKTFWQEHTSPGFPPPPLPIVDFNNTMVVGVFLGNRGSGGYAVECLDVGTDKGGTVVRYREHRPRAGLANTQALTQPYFWRVVPRRDGDVRFLEEPDRP